MSDIEKAARLIADRISEVNSARLGLLLLVARLTGTDALTLRDRTALLGLASKIRSFAPNDMNDARTTTADALAVIDPTEEI